MIEPGRFQISQWYTLRVRAEPEIHCPGALGFLIRGLFYPAVESYDGTGCVYGTRALFTDPKKLVYEFGYVQDGKFVAFEKDASGYGYKLP